MNAIEDMAARFATPLIYWIALLGLCAAYLQGGIDKATQFGAAIAEMERFGLDTGRTARHRRDPAGVGRFDHDPC